MPLLVKLGICELAAGVMSGWAMIAMVERPEALKQLGYNDGQTILIEPRYAEGQPGRLGVMARELVALTPAVIVCVGRQETVALQAATHTIPGGSGKMD